MKDKFKIAHDNYSSAISNQDYDDSIGELGDLISQDIEVTTCLTLRSHLYSLSGDINQAISDLDRAIELIPNSGSLYYSRGDLHRKDKGYYLSLRDLVEAVRLAQSKGDDDLIDAAEHIFIEIFEKMRSQ